MLCWPALRCPAATGMEPATVIRLRPSITIEATDAGWTATLALAHAGTESAHHPSITTTFGGQSHAWPPAPEILEPGGTLTLSHAWRDPAPRPRGEHPMLVRIDYRDASGYPFSSILLATATDLPVDADPAPGLTLQLYPPETLQAEGIVRLVAVSSLPVPVTARIRLMAPDTLTVVDPEQTLTLPAGAARGLSFSIHDRGSRAGSRLAISASATVTIDGLQRCVTRSAAVAVAPHRGLLERHPVPWLILAVILLLGFGAWQCNGVARWTHRNPKVAGLVQRFRLTGVGWIIAWAAILVFLTAYIPPALVLRDSLTVGGDTPAHNFLAQHLRTHWFSEGRLLTWSHAWWSGFPAFQFYFPLPYVLIALLSAVVPFNIAFKLVCILGIGLLPGSVYLAGRILRVSRAAAVLMMAAVIPFLFTDVHVMWGVNLYSTLAGMIANSISFALFPVCLALAWRDADRGRASLAASLAMAGLMLTHFFTSIMAALVIAAIPLMRPRAGFRGALTTLLRDGLRAMLLASWWLIPLLAKRGYSVDFGENWDVGLLSSLPGSAWVAVPAALAALLVDAGTRTANPNQSPWLWLWMVVAATVLFVAGYAVSPVFVNIRLWPFIFFGLLMLGAMGIGRLLDRCRAPFLAVSGLFLLVLLRVDTAPSHIRSWAEWNLEGLEAKPLAGEFQRLIAPLDGTPGRLANDLHDANKAFGSSRIFEVVPHLIDKPIIEGGLVNSALGALFAYTIQGGISRQGAGYPTLVPPAAFDPDLAQRHLDLFNVRHIIAAWPPLQDALHASEHWHGWYRVDRWDVFEAAAADAGLIGVLDRPPAAVATRDRQRAAVAWMQTPALLDQPFIWLAARQEPPAGSDRITDDAYQALLQQASASNTVIPALFNFDPEPVTLLEWSSHRIRFRTEAVGRPHLVKTSYFPNWQAHGAAAVHMISPAFMVLTPEQPDVDLVYGTTIADRIGHGATVAGLIWILLTILRRADARNPEVRSQKSEVSGH